MKYINKIRKALIITRKHDQYDCHLGVQFQNCLISLLKSNQKWEKQSFNLVNFQKFYTWNHRRLCWKDGWTDRRWFRQELYIKIESEENREIMQSN